MPTLSSRITAPANGEWLANRQEFASSLRIICHYAAVTPDGRIIAYGAVEQLPEERAYGGSFVPSNRLPSAGAKPPRPGASVAP